MGIIDNREVTESGKTNLPIWFMRQAGRYHEHYQGYRKQYDFMTMCKTPKLASEITLGPIDDFDFDAAILFSDLLFPLDQMGMGLSYLNGPPTLEFRIEKVSDLKKLEILKPADEFYNFQKSALTILREKLSTNKTLLGFVGAPFTLYTYAVEGSHSGSLTSSKLGLYDGRFDGFMEILIPQLVENMKIQAEGGADVMCLFDTAAGELTLEDYKEKILPMIRKVTEEFKESYPDKKIIYYSKFTHIHYLREIKDKNIDVLGIDWRCDLKEVLLELGNDYFIQGNMDPSYLYLPWDKLEVKVEAFWNRMKDLPRELLNKWIFGLGHGVMPKTPEENVRKVVEYIHNNCHY